jgi:hypothetical protein
VVQSRTSLGGTLRSVKLVPPALEAAGGAWIVYPHLNIFEECAPPQVKQETGLLLARTPRSYSGSVD